MKNKNIADKIFFSRGFTLVEMIVYMAMLGVISILITNSFIAMTKSFGAVKLSRVINNSALAVMERSSREIRFASQVNDGDSVFGSSPGALSLIGLNDQGEAIETKIYMLGTDIFIKKGESSPESLTSSSTVTTNLIFTKINAANTSVAIKFEFEIAGNVTTGDSGIIRSGINRTDKFYNTIILRGGY